jgi:hypothetical protein
MAQVYEEAYRSRNSEESFIAARLADLEEGLDRYEGPMPLWRFFLTDRLGNAWMSEFFMPAERAERWRVVKRDGTFEGWVEIPGISDVLDITGDRVLAVKLDDMEVPALVMLELIKPE